jgi:hypothetical protein
MNNNSNTFTTNSETLFLVNILNTMYNDNLRQITNLTDMLNGLNNSNNQIRNLLVQLLNRNQRRNSSRRLNTNLNNIDYSTLTNGINLTYLFDEYTIPLNTDGLHNVNRQSNRSNRRNGYTTLDGYARNLFDNFLQPVEIYPTQSQIESATRRVRYCDIMRPINTSCPITMDEFNDTDMVTVIRHCGHTFHTDNIMNWFRSNCRCPVCRYDIREYNSNASNEFFDNSQRRNDSSNNYLERNINNRNNRNNSNNSNNNNSNNSNNIYNTLLTDDYINLETSSLENLLRNSSIFDSSGNNSTDIFTTFLINTLNTSRNAR